MIRGKKSCSLLSGGNHMTAPRLKTNIIITFLIQTTQKSVTVIPKGVVLLKWGSCFYVNKLMNELVLSSHFFSFVTLSYCVFFLVIFG